MLTALIAFLIAVVLLAWLELRCTRWLHYYPEFDFFLLRVLLPLLRLGTLIVLVFTAYPELFARPDLSLPSLATTLSIPHDWLADSINFLVIGTFLLPSIPIIGQRPELVVPLQSAILIALLFSWTATATGLAHFTAWPGFATAFELTCYAWLGGFIGRRAVLLVPGERWDRSATDLAVLLFQLPAIWRYSQALGTQL